MASNVNVIIGNWRQGTNVTIARRLVDVSIEYTNNVGEQVTKSGTIIFPDILGKLSADDLKELAMDIMLKAYRKSEDID